MNPNLFALIFALALVAFVGVSHLVGYLLGAERARRTSEGGLAITLVLIPVVAIGLAIRQAL